MMNDLCWKLAPTDSNPCHQRQEVASARVIGGSVRRSVHFLKALSADNSAGARFDHFFAEVANRKSSVANPYREHHT